MTSLPFLQRLIKEHYPAEEIVAGKIKRNMKGQITGVYVFWSSPSLVRCPCPSSSHSRGLFTDIPCAELQPGKAKSENVPKVDPAEIDKIGRVFAAIRRQPADRTAATVGFTFRGEDYLAKREPCISTGPHVRGAVCFSGSKPSVSPYLMFDGLAIPLSVDPCEESQRSLPPEQRQ